MLRQIVTTDTNGKTLWVYKDEGPRVCVPHIAQRTATQNGIPVRIPIRARQHHRIGGDS